MLNVFASADMEFIFSELAEPININGKPYSVVIDNERLFELKRKGVDGVVSGDILFFIRKSELAKPFDIGDVVAFGSKKVCMVSEVKEDAGIYEIILEYNRA